MTLQQQLDLDRGTWMMANCGAFPSENQCRLVILAPAGQEADLLQAAAAHAVRNHGHQDTPQLREDLKAMLVTLSV